MTTGPGAGGDDEERDAPPDMPPPAAEPAIPRPSWWQMPGEPEPPLVFYGPPVPSPFAGLSIRPGRIVATALDLLAHSSAELRRGSFYIGLVVLGTTAPVALLTWRLFDELGEDLFLPTSRADDGLAFAWVVAIVVAVAGIFVASIESRAVAISVLAARLAGRRLELRDAVQRSRTIFWRLFWTGVLAGIPLSLVQAILQEALSGVFGRDTEGAVLVSSLTAALLLAPLAYVQAGVVLGDVGPLEAVKRSIRVYNARRVVGTVVALFEFGSQFLTVFALLTGLDLVVRFVDAAGLGASSDATAAALTVGLIIVLLFAAGTLVFTVAAISAVPQVVAFVALTHAAPGLDRIENGSDLRFRWLTRPMLAAMIIAAFAFVSGIASIS